MFSVNWRSPSLFFAPIWILLSIWHILPMSLTVWSDYLRHLSLVKAAAFLISSYFEAMDPDELNNGLTRLPLMRMMIIMVSVVVMRRRRMAKMMIRTRVESATLPSSYFLWAAKAREARHQFTLSHFSAAVAPRSSCWVVPLASVQPLFCQLLDAFPY